MSLPVIGISGFADQSARLPDLPLYGITQTYVHAVEQGGGAPVIIPPYVGEEGLRALFEHLDGLVLSGGGDIQPALYGEASQGPLWRVDDRRDQTEIALAQWAMEKSTPLLAICRGAQVLNVAAGGTLVQDIPTQVTDALSHSSPVAGRPVPAVAHPVDVLAKTRLAALVGAGELGVNSAHHQAVKDLGSGLVATARAPDGVIESIEAPDRAFCVGVQWHPEVMVDSQPVMRRLFEGLAEAAQNRLA